VALRVLVLGAGFGGLEVSTGLTETLGDDVEVTLIDHAAGFVFGFSKLDVLFGRATSESVLHRYTDLTNPRVRFIQSTVRGIDPIARRVQTDAGGFTGDVLVVALGANVDPHATPGLTDMGHEFYSNAGAFDARNDVMSFGGGSVVVGVTSTPFKCPPAPSETALMMHELLERNGLRDRSDIALVMPFGVPVPPSPEASQALLGAFVERRIRWVPERLVTELDPSRRVARLDDGTELEADLFLGVPRHHVPSVVEQSGLCEDGWVAVDPRTLRTNYDDVYAVGDMTSAGTPKAGVFAEGQAKIVVAQIAARHHDRDSAPTYDGRGVCYLEFGADEVATVDVTFAPGQAPHGTLVGPSPAMVADKSDFGTSRIRRWFGT
jgi:sulfide:quinone oxidoreductase